MIHIREYVFNVQKHQVCIQEQRVLIKMSHYEVYDLFQVQD